MIYSHVANLYLYETKEEGFKAGFIDLKGPQRCMHSDMNGMESWVQKQNKGQSVFFCVESFFLDSVQHLLYCMVQCIVSSQATLHSVQLSESMYCTVVTVLLVVVSSSERFGQLQ